DDPERPAPRRRPIVRPEDPGQVRRGWIQGRRVPGRTAIRAHFDQRDPAVPREGDAAKMDQPVHDRAVRGRRDDGSRVNLALVRPAFLLPETAVFAFYGLDLGEPFGVEHPVQTGDDDAAGTAVCARY